jgi:hypothetical protein
MKLPNPERAVVSEQKLAGYCLNFNHFDGQHKARVFKSALDFNPEHKMKLLDTVALLEDLPELRLYRGQVGTIVEEYEPKVFEVEFSSTTGCAYALETLKADQLMLLHHHPLQANNLTSV